MVIHFPQKQFTQVHVQAIASLVEFQESRKAMLAQTPISEYPTLYERTQTIEDEKIAEIRVHAGGVKSQRDSVMLDNLVLDEIDMRRARREVRSHKRSFLSSGLGGRA